MKKKIDEVKAREAGLIPTTIQVYVPLEPNQIGEVANYKGRVDYVESKSKSVAERQRKHKVKLAEKGLGQINLILPASQEIRSQMSSLAGRIVQTGEWETAIAAEPFVKALQNELTHAKIRLLRIDDLEERHRRMPCYLNFHYEISTATGLKKVFLRLAGVYRELLPAGEKISSPK